MFYHIMSLAPCSPYYTGVSTALAKNRGAESAEIRRSNLPIRAANYITGASIKGDQKMNMTLPRLLYHYILEYPALIDSASTGMPVEKFSVSFLINSSGVRFPSELCGLAVL